MHAEAGDDLFIPRYDDVFREVLERYHADFRAEDATLTITNWLPAV